MAKIADCVERMFQFKQQCRGAAYDLKPYLFTARIPGRDEPFRPMSVCKLMDAVEHWAAEETVARLLSGAGPASARGTADDRLPVLVWVRHPTTRTGLTAIWPSAPAITSSA